METATTYTVTISDNVFSDWRTRGMIDNINENAERCVIVKRTKTLCTLSMDEGALDFFISDLEIQIGIIQQNGDGESPSMFKRALAKLNAAKG